MRPFGQKGRTPYRQAATVVREDADPAAFGCNVDTFSVGMVGQHVGRFADTLVLGSTSVNCCAWASGSLASTLLVCGPLSTSAWMH